MAIYKLPSSAPCLGLCPTHSPHSRLERCWAEWTMLISQEGHGKSRSTGSTVGSSLWCSDSVSSLEGGSEELSPVGSSGGGAANWGLRATTCGDCFVLRVVQTRHWGTKHSGGSAAGAGTTSRRFGRTSEQLEAGHSQSGALGLWGRAGPLL